MAANEAEDECHSSLRGSASQFFVAGELCRRGIVAVVTLGNCPNTDILCSNLHGDRFAHVQVKTFPPGRAKCSVGMKAEIDRGPGFFWVLGGIPSPGSDRPFEYYVIPSPAMAAHVRASFVLWRDAPGVGGRRHDAANTIRTVAIPPKVCKDGWDIKEYRGRWDLIESHLRGGTTS